MSRSYVVGLVLAGVWMVDAVAGAAETARAGAGDGAPASAQAIMTKATRRAYYAGDDVRLRASMQIADRRGGAKHRTFVVLRRNQERADSPEPANGRRFGTGQKYFIYFEEPPEVRRMVFMAWKGREGDDDRWLYLPALDLVQRIASAQKRSAFAGSHFFYEDIYGRRATADDHEWVETTEDYYVIRSVPKEPGEVEFGSYTSWIHKETFVTVRRQYERPSGKVYRRYDALRTEQIQGHVTVTESRMQDLESNGATTLRSSSIQYDLGLDDSLFTERYLRLAPAQVLHW